MKIYPATAAPAGTEFAPGFKYILLTRYSPGGSSFPWEPQGFANVADLPTQYTELRTQYGPDYGRKVIEQPTEYWPTPAPEPTKGANAYELRWMAKNHVFSYYRDRLTEQEAARIEYAYIRAYKLGQNNTVHA